MRPRRTSHMQDSDSATQLQPGYQMSLQYISERVGENRAQEKRVRSNSLVETKGQSFYT